MESPEKNLGQKRSFPSLAGTLFKKRAVACQPANPDEEICEIHGRQELSALRLRAFAAAIVLQRLASCGNGKGSGGICSVCNEL